MHGAFFTHVWDKRKNKTSYSERLLTQITNYLISVHWIDVNEQRAEAPLNHQLCEAARTQTEHHHQVEDLFLHHCCISGIGTPSRMPSLFLSLHKLLFSLIMWRGIKANSESAQIYLGFRYTDTQIRDLQLNKGTLHHPIRREVMWNELTVVVGWAECSQICQVCGQAGLVPSHH